MKRDRLYITLLVVVAFGLGLGSSIIYANRAARQAEARAVAVARETERVGLENDRRWCALLTDLDGAYSSAPPQTELGRRIALAIHELRTGFGC